MRLSGGICLECRRVGSDISGNAVGNTGNSMNSVLMRDPALIGTYQGSAEHILNEIVQGAETMSKYQ